MDKKELVQKIIESAVARGGVFLEDRLLANAIESLLDDYPVINKGDFDWHGATHADMVQFDNHDNCADINMSVAINAYGEVWAGDGKIAIVAYAWSAINSPDTDQLVGRAEFEFDTVRQLTLEANLSTVVERLYAAIETRSGVMCDPEYANRILGAVVEHTPITHSQMAVKLRTYSISVYMEQDNTTIIRVGIEDEIIGMAKFSFKKFWDILLND